MSSPTLLPIVAMFAGCLGDPEPARFNIVDRSPRRTTPTVQIAIEGQPVRLLFDTGWPGLSLEPNVLPALPRSDTKPYVRKSWGKPAEKLGLMPVTVALGGRSGTVHGVERSAEAFSPWAYYEVQGIAGMAVVTTLGSRLHYRPPNSARITGTACPGTDEKLFVMTEVGGVPIEAFVDTGAVTTRLFRQGLAEDRMTLPNGQVVPAERLTEKQVQARAGGAMMDGRRLDAVLGWDNLRELEWTIDACAQTVTFGPDAEDSAER